MLILSWTQSRSISWQSSDTRFRDMFLSRLHVSLSFRSTLHSYSIHKNHDPLHNPSLKTRRENLLEPILLLLRRLH